MNRPWYKLEKLGGRELVKGTEIVAYHMADIVFVLLAKGKAYMFPISAIEVMGEDLYTHGSANEDMLIKADQVTGIFVTKEPKTHEIEGYFDVASFVSESLDTIKDIVEGLTENEKFGIELRDRFSGQLLQSWDSLEMQEVIALVGTEGSAILKKRYCFIG